MPTEPLSLPSHLSWLAYAANLAGHTAQQDMPIACVIIYRRQVIAAAVNAREAMHDPTGHAELLAMRQAARYLGDWRLRDCWVYVTLEPCLMCAAALAQARVAGVVFGLFSPLSGGCGSVHQLLPPGIETIGPLLENTHAVLYSHRFGR
jgi:tRNA(adenine34) deaminase